MPLAKPVAGPAPTPTPVQEVQQPTQDDHSWNREPKNPNSVGPQYKRKFFHDGGYREYIMAQIPNEDHLFIEISNAVGIDEGGQARFRNELAHITKMTAEYLQTDDHEEVRKFILHLLRKTPSTGHRVPNLLREVQKVYRQDSEIRTWIK